MQNEQQELLTKLDELEERIDIQILTLQVLRGHLDELSARLDRIREDLV
jgi:chaperonin cofactor prefoldin